MLLLGKQRGNKSEYHNHIGRLKLPYYLTNLCNYSQQGYGDADFKLCD